MRERIQMDRDSGLRASSSLMRLLTHLFDTDLSSSPPMMTNQLVPTSYYPPGTPLTTFGGEKTPSSACLWAMTVVCSFL
jgi:hypothetical protein